MATGLNTGLNPTFGIKTVKHGYDNLEGFLTAVEKPFLNEAFKRRRFECQNRKTSEIYDVIQILKKSRCVCVPTDKTNSTGVINIEDYKWWASYHLQKTDNLAIRPKVMALFEDANLLLEKVKKELSVKEEEFVRQLLATRAIPSPKLLIKDQKTINEKGGSPIRLVIPATNFTATFSKFGYLGIKRCMEKGKVNYSRYSIVQASDLKERIEELEVTREEVTIASVDAINMYPSIKIATIRKAVIYLAIKLTKETKKTINLLLELIHFRMSSTLIS